MYDYDDSNESDYSLEYSDYEYNTLEPYHYDLNVNDGFEFSSSIVFKFQNFKVEIKESPEDKLLKHIQNNELSEIKELMPSLLVEEKSDHLPDGDEYPNANCNNNNNVSEGGDAPSDISSEEYSDFEEEKPTAGDSNTKYREIFLKNGDTPLMAAAADCKVEIISYFLSLGFNVNFKLKHTNKTALLALFVKPNSNMWGIDRHSENVEKLLKCLQVLLDAGADVKAKCYLISPDYGNTALHYAAQNNYWEALDFLINAGGDIDSTNNQKLTALHIAASKGHVACCNTLLLAGANSKLVERSGNTASELAEVGGFNHLSDAINVYSGNAQHNVRLYKIWRQYSSKFITVDKEASFNNIEDNITFSHSCIESFSLALNAPYLTKLMEDQGISINDLKFMDESKLQEFGVPEKDCKTVMVAMKDLNKKSKSTKKINFAYGKPLKSITMLEMLGNIGEHIEFIDTNLEAMWCHMNRNEKFYLEKFRIVNKSTVDNLRTNSNQCIDFVNRLRRETDNLKNIINQQNQDDIDCNGDIMPSTTVPNAINVDSDSKNCEGSVFSKSILITSIAVICLSAVILSRRYL